MGVIWTISQQSPSVRGAKLPAPKRPKQETSRDIPRCPPHTKWKVVLEVTFRHAVSGYVCSDGRLHAMEPNDVESFEIDLRRGRPYGNRNCGGSFVAGPRPADVLPLAGRF